VGDCTGSSSEKVVLTGQHRATSTGLAKKSKSQKLLPDVKEEARGQGNRKLGGQEVD